MTVFYSYYIFDALNTNYFRLKIRISKILQVLEYKIAGKQ